MRDRIAGLIVLLAVLLLGGSLYYSSRLKETSRAERQPARKPERPRGDAAVKAALESVETLRQLRSAQRIPPAGVGHPDYEKRLDAIRGTAPETLYYLEEIALDRTQDSLLRVDLVNVVAGCPGEETRLFLSALFGDPTEEEAVRLAALEPLMRYTDAATFEVLKRAYLDPMPFGGRYHICRAFGENGQTAAIPLLFDALMPGRPYDIRCHAALGLGGFVEERSVQAELRRLALADAVAAVRQNALQSLAQSGSPEAQQILREVASSSAADPGTREVAARLLELREKKR